MKSLIDFGIKDELVETYFRADNFCKVYHDNIEVQERDQEAGD